MNYYYADLMNIFNFRRKGSNEKINNEYLSLLTSCLADKAFRVSDEDFMQPDFYRNAVIYATTLRNFKWADNFVNVYTKELKPEIRDNMMYYSKAVISSAKGDYESSLEYISKVKYDLAIFKFDVKVITLKIFYELGMDDQFYSLAETFRQYVKNSKNLTDEYADSYRNYINYFLKIVKLRSLYSKDKSVMLKKEIENEKYIYERNWLRNKLGLLEK